MLLTIDGRHVLVDVGEPQRARGRPPVDPALDPFWFLTAATAAATVAGVLKPKESVALHLPLDAAESVGRTSTKNGA